MLHLTKLNTKTVYKELTYKNSSDFLRIMAVIALFNLVLIGFFGIIGGLINAKGKVDTMSEMSTLLDDMQVKEAQLAEAKTTFDKARPYAVTLNSFITDKPDLQTYLISLQNAFATNGFILTKFAPEVGSSKSAPTDFIRVTVNSKGNPTQLGVLLSAVEELPRFTKVISASASFVYADLSSSYVTVNLEVYRSLIQ